MIMIKKILFALFFFFGCFTLQSQIIRGKIMNKTSLKPIDEVAIITNLKTGTTSNKLGFFTLQIDNVESITFSCLGFASTTIKINALKEQNFIVSLFENIDQLDEIKLNFAKISLDSLLIKTQKSMNDNFITGPVKHCFYMRENTEVDFKKLELDLEKSSLLSRKNRKLAEQELIDYANELQNSKPAVASEFSGILSFKGMVKKKKKKNSDIIKVDSVKGYKFSTGKKNINLKEAQSDLQTIILKHLNKDKTYKISSGLFTIEDSLSMKKVLHKSDSIKANNTFKEYEPMYSYRVAKRNSTFFSEKNEPNFFDQKYYNHILEQKEVLGTSMAYVISFTPRKSKSKYRGRIFIHPKDFTVAKIEYEFAEGKRGMHVNLKWVLGVKVSLNLKKVTLFYEKNMEDKVYNSYYKETSETHAYVHKPIKFKENSKTKNKVKFDIKVELKTKETIEVLLLDAINIAESAIKPVEKVDLGKNITYTSLKDYNNTKWKNRKLIIDYLKKYE